LNYEYQEEPEDPNGQHGEDEEKEDDAAMEEGESEQEQASQLPSCYNDDGSYAVDVVPVYRYWSAGAGDHFYTTNANEIGTTTAGQVGNHGYKCEGIAFYVFASKCSQAVPIYRYWKAAGSDHFYTTDESEIGTTTSGEKGNHDYVSEGILGYIFPDETEDGTPIYRYWKAANTDHFYTTNSNEIGTTDSGQAGQFGYVSEGVLGYGVTPESEEQKEEQGGAQQQGQGEQGEAADDEGCFDTNGEPLAEVIPIYRYYLASVVNHFYTPNPAEIGTTQVGKAGNYGYVCEGVGFKLFKTQCGNSVPVYRYFKGAGTDHFYTTNPDEIGTTTKGTVGNYGYVSEGIIGYALTEDTEHSLPVYRYWNAGKTDHFYTSNGAEIGTVEAGQVGKYGFKSEGTAFFGVIADDEAPKTCFKDDVTPNVNLVKIYRYWNADKTDHMYTNDPNEMGTITPGEVGKDGYKCEGVAFELFVQPCAEAVPVYRYWNKAWGDHFYTTNVKEIGVEIEGNTGNYGFISEGILGYALTEGSRDSVPVYRYFKGGVSDHFYTTNIQEIGTGFKGELGNFGYVSEGVGFYAIKFVKDDYEVKKCFVDGHVNDETLPIYRYWNAANTDHFYTKNGNEIGTITSGETGQYGYKSEGIGFYLFKNNCEGSIPVYRYWNKAWGDHFYTTNSKEIGTSTPGTQGNYGFVNEGILGYALPENVGCTLPVYRYFKGGVSDHFYTLNINEIGTATKGQVGKYGYVSEGVGFYSADL